MGDEVVKEKNSERVSNLIDPELLKVGTPLENIRHEAFCQLYASDLEFFGNGTQSYIKVYNPVQRGNWYNVVRANASKLLTNANVLKRIDELLNFDGFNEQAVDKELKFVIAQRNDLASKVSAIREFNRLKARVTEKMDMTTAGQPIGVTIYKPERLKEDEADNEL